MEDTDPLEIMLGLADHIIASGTTNGLEIYLATAVISTFRELPFNSEGMADVAHFVKEGSRYSIEGRRLAKLILNPIE